MRPRGRNLLWLRSHRGQGDERQAVGGSLSTQTGQPFLRLPPIMCVADTVTVTVAAAATTTQPK
ncbi:hypothetical protein CGRA01v4_05422 [Colletotrichum graminicola]|nr:hypothetical protein CGRA01v4_05422 [Colletotrichum graminicola]